MIINDTNYEIGNKAMAWVLLLYYHLVDEGGITIDQTVYLDPKVFNGFDYLGVEVKENYGQSLNINETLIREGAIIFLLCDLNDIIDEHYETFHSHPRAKKIIEALKRHEKMPIPEVASLLKHVLVAESNFEHAEYSLILQGIYKLYVHGFFAKKFGP